LITINNKDAKELFDSLTTIKINKEFLENICAHRDYGWKERKYSFWGTNFTKSAQLLRMHIDTGTDKSIISN
jgi:hypothetical protein